MPRYEAVLTRVSGSLDGRPLPVNRAQVIALVRYWDDQRIFREVHPPEALDAGVRGAARLELEEHYRFAGRVVDARMRLRVALPDREQALDLEVGSRVARDAVAARSLGEARQAMLGQAQRANLASLEASLRREPILFEARSLGGAAGPHWRAAGSRCR